MSDVSAPSRAGRSPYNSEPSIEAPDSTTTPRRIGGETPAIMHYPHHQALPRCASRSASKVAAVDTAPRIPRACRGVAGRVSGRRCGRCCCRRPWPPTQVTGRNPLILRFRSGVSAAVVRVLGTGGAETARQLHRSLAVSPPTPVQVTEDLQIQRLLCARDGQLNRSSPRLNRRRSHVNQSTQESIQHVRYQALTCVACPGARQRPAPARRRASTFVCPALRQKRGVAACHPAPA
jgi:hypothetical protein